ncbi:MAG: SRPBCC family protein [Paludibacteraceae bacterium]|nr:SRPBCC family protein [Paludibacteraceae bacterium]
MSEQKYESKIQSIPAPVDKVYPVLSNMMNLERVRDLIPADKVQEMDLTEDAVKFKVDGLAQKVTIRIVDKIENDTIKFGLDNMPVAGNFWIQLKEVAPNDTRVKLTVKADIPVFFRMMIEKKLQQGLDDAAVMLTQFPYTNWS